MKILQNKKQIVVALAILLIGAVGFFGWRAWRAEYWRKVGIERQSEAEQASLNDDAASHVKPIDSQVSPADGMTQLLVPAGAFLMGDGDKAEKNGPQHEVGLSAFWIDRTEISNAMYALCAAAKKCGLPFHGNLNPMYDDSAFANYPVVYVTWKQAGEYCAWAGRRLPTEAEWEKAARGIDGRIYPWGDDAPDMTRANFALQVGASLPVDRYPLGASPYGALNMAGNVREWVLDWFHPLAYLGLPTLNPQGPPEGGKRILRGGSYLDDANEIRAFNRFAHEPGSAGINRGFRCAMNAQ